MQTKPAQPLPPSRLGAVLAFAGLALFLVLVIFVRHSKAPAVELNLAQVPETDRWRFSDAGRAEKLRALREAERQAASTYGWVDKDKGLVRLPVDQAMELTLGELNKARNASQP